MSKKRIDLDSKIDIGIFMQRINIDKKVGIEENRYLIKLQTG